MCRNNRNGSHAPQRDRKRLLDPLTASRSHCLALERQHFAGSAVAQIVGPMLHHLGTAQMCAGCHGAGLQGGKIAGAPPDWPAAARLAPGNNSVMPTYASSEAFVAMMRSGKRADGSAIAVMPFESLKTMNDTDLRALHMYLAQLKPN